MIYIYFDTHELVLILIDYEFRIMFMKLRQGFRCQQIDI